MDCIPILIVDSNKSHLKLEKLVLSEANYDIRTAANANDAMKILGEFHPRLILVGIELTGGIDGLELTQKIKADSRYQDIVIVALTAHAMPGDKEMALSAGCDGYLSKPIDVDTFLEIIADYIVQPLKK